MKVLARWTPASLVRIFSAPYIAGSSLQAAIQKVDDLWEQSNLQATLDLLGEGIQSKADIEAGVREYLLMLDAIGSREYATVSLKPTQMGLGVDNAFCQYNIERIVRRAAQHNIQVTIDMEESRFVDQTLQIHRNLREQYSNVGTVLQARLFRTEADIDTYLDGLKAHIRLCIGIYPEPPAIAYQTKEEIKDNFFRLLPKLWERGHFVGIATHDERLLSRCLGLAKQHNIPKAQYEVQMLLGVPRMQIQQHIIRQGIPMRLYVPYATMWKYAIAYCRRRMAENPHMVLYVLSNLLQRLQRPKQTTT